MINQTQQLHGMHNGQLSTTSIHQTITHAAGPLHHLFKHIQMLQRLNILFYQWLSPKLHDQCSIANLRDQTLVITVTRPALATMMIGWQQEILTFFEQNGWPNITHTKICVHPDGHRFNPTYPLYRQQTSVKFAPTKLPGLSKHAQSILQDTARTLTTAALQPLQHVLKKIAAHGPRNNNDEY